MKLNIISDFHADRYSDGFIDYGEFVPENLESADYLIIAGDISLNNDYKLVLKDIKERTKNLFNKVLYVRGNHDYWQYPSRISNEIIHYDDRYLKLDLGDTVILGCTLWSPITTNRDYIGYAMNDYRYIPNFTIDDNNRLFEEESNWLCDNYDFYKERGSKIIIVTHHVPNKELIPIKYLGDKINSAFTVMDGSLDNIHPDLWICGHTHDYCDKIINGTRYIRNPIGYSHEYLPNKTWYNKIVEI